MSTGRFELRKDEETGRLYWWGHEDGWKDATEIGEDGVLTLDAQHFAVGAVLSINEPDTEDMTPALEQVKQEWKQHDCPSVSGICECIFDISCQSCGMVLKIHGESLDYVIGIGGLCERCYYTPIDQALSNLRAIKSLNDDPHIEEIVDVTADLLYGALHPDDAAQTEASQ